LDIFDNSCNVTIPDPVYPVYVDTNIMLGRNVTYIDGNESNGFLPMPGSAGTDLIYLCSPNNPTGAVYNREQLKQWVEYANANEAIILFDSAYEAFVSDPQLPSSIFEIPGSRTCAIEFCSFSKTAGFTGVRCGYTVVPLELKRRAGVGAGEKSVSLNDLWLRRQTTKFNGVSYITQAGAAAALLGEGYAQAMQNLSYYKNNTQIIREALDELGIWYTGGVHSPYVWLKCQNMLSWEFFDFLLQKAGVVGTPGSGFGRNGEGFFRLTGFGKREDVEMAMYRMKQVLS
jgi:LL-diaminopimelate aminotransferase